MSRPDDSFVPLHAVLLKSLILADARCIALIEIPAIHDTLISQM